jgi:polygalacturonase
LNSPFWVLHPLFCEDLTVRGVKVYNRGPNGDGCDPESCKNVLIENCTFDTGDDCIAIKSGRNLDGRKWNVPSENIVVRGCHMVNGHGGVVVGSEISGGYRNLYVEDCTMDSPELERVIRIKTSSCRGGVIENVFVRNVKVGQCKEAVLRINLDYEAKEVCQRGNNPTVRNVLLENVTCQESRYGVVLIGLEDVCNIYDVTLKNCEFNGVTGDKKTGALNSYTGRFRDVQFDDLKINGQLVASPEARP